MNILLNPVIYVAYKPVIVNVLRAVLKKLVLVLNILILTTSINAIREKKYSIL